MRFFLKDYGRSRRPRPAPAQRRERELGVYRHLIGGGELGTARYCGAVWDDDIAVHWLLLEFVAGAELRHLELRFWIEAARWLGRLQGRFAGSPALAKAMPVLERHDARFFEAKAERARGSVSHYSPALAHRLEGILERYEASIDLMAGQDIPGPRALRRDEHPRGRRCETRPDLPGGLGARGAGIALLRPCLALRRFQPPALHRIWDAYAEGAADAGLPTPARDRLRHLVDCSRLFKVIAWLGSAAEKRYSPSGVGGSWRAERSWRRWWSHDPAAVAKRRDADAGLGVGLDTAVRRAAGPGAEVVSVHRTPSPHATVFPPRWSRRARFGRAHLIFVKHLGRSSEPSRQARPRARGARVWRAARRPWPPRSPIPRF